MAVKDPAPGMVWNKCWGDWFATKPGVLASSCSRCEVWPPMRWEDLNEWDQEEVLERGIGVEPKVYRQRQESDRNPL